MKKLTQSWQRFWRGVLGVVFLLFAGITVGTLQGCMGVPAKPIDGSQEIEPDGCQPPPEPNPAVEEPAEQRTPKLQTYGEPVRLDDELYYPDDWVDQSRARLKRGEDYRWS